jgi:NadR type nicotinamide-nucleotide adenylyltransferase
VKLSVLRVALFGFESTGKSRLAEHLSAHFAEPWAPEFVRGFWDERAGVIKAEDLETIGRGQAALEDAAASRARRVVFCDTELLSCTLWNDLLFPAACPPWVRAEAERRAPSYALYLLCEADVPFAPDPQRCFPAADDRARLSVRWREALVQRGLPMVELRGTWTERQAAAVAAVDRLLGVVDTGGSC